jgi:hypothetical protein
MEGPGQYVQLLIDTMALALTMETYLPVLMQAKFFGQILALVST